MKKLVGIAALFVTGALVGCAGEGADPGADGVESNDADLVSMRSPESLARWLGTNHALAWMPQFLDTRPGGQLVTTNLLCDGWSPVMGCYRENQAAPFIYFSAAEAGDPFVRDVQRIGKAADEAIAAGQIRILLDQPVWEAPDQKISRSCYTKPGVFVYTTHDTTAQDISLQANGDFFGRGLTAEQKEKARQASRETNVDVTIVLPPPPNGDSYSYGDEATEKVPVIHLSFGVVQRPLTAGAQPSWYWTVLAARGDGRCQWGDS